MYNLFEVYKIKKKIKKSVNEMFDQDFKPVLLLLTCIFSSLCVG